MVGVETVLVLLEELQDLGLAAGVPFFGGFYAAFLVEVRKGSGRVDREG